MQEMQHASMPTCTALWRRGQVSETRHQSVQALQQRTLYSLVETPSLKRYFITSSLPAGLGMVVLRHGRCSSTWPAPKSLVLVASRVRSGAAEEKERDLRYSGNSVDTAALVPVRLPLKEEPDRNFLEGLNELSSGVTGRLVISTSLQ